MRPFSLLIKPASATCNLSCAYCFYRGNRGFDSKSSQARMAPAVLETMIKKYLATDQTDYVFGWQGGEPTLMGVDFFRLVTELQQQHGRNGARVANGVQTNGLLINDELAEHFQRYKFLLGVSLDGPEAVHDHYRRRHDGRGSHAEVMRGLGILKRHQVEFNILALINDRNVNQAAALYNYYREHGFHYLQYIPCVEFDRENRPLPFTVTGEAWGDFLCATFDLWHKSDFGTVSIRLFDAILNLLVDHRQTICHLGQNCCQYFVVEYNGDVFPCDFFVRDELKVGNIMHDGWGAMQSATVYKEFGRRKRQWSDECADCKFLSFCAGDCLKHRLYGNVTRPENLSRLCSGWKKFLTHSLPGFRQLAEAIIRERRAASAGRPDAGSDYRPQNIGRNAPCPCGSGRKFKKCCLSRQATDRG